MYVIVLRSIQIIFLVLLLGTQAFGQYFATSDVGTLRSHTINQKRYSSCTNPSNPCGIRAALRKARKKQDSRLYIKLPRSGAVVRFRQSFFGKNRLDKNLSFQIYAIQDQKIVNASGKLQIGGSLEIAPRTSLHLGSGVQLQVRRDLRIFPTAKMFGPGFLVFKGFGATRTIQLGDPSSPPPHTKKIGTIENLGVDMGTNGKVRVRDQAEYDGITSELYITNALVILSGDLDMTTNQLHLSADADPDLSGNKPRVEVAGGSRIYGTKNLVIQVKESGMAGGFPNTIGDAFPITGDGTIFMDFSKNTDAGVLYDLPEAGGGLNSSNSAGIMFFPRVKKIYGEFINIGGARTEFGAAVEILGGLKVEGPGAESGPADGACNTGNESGVFFTQASTIAEHLTIDTSDDPVTAGCTEGVTFAASEISNPNALLNAPFSVVTGPLNLINASGLTLESSTSVSHNLKLEGDLTVTGDPSLLFNKAYQGSTTCNSPLGNALIFSGSTSPQTINSVNPLLLPAVQLQKAADDQEVVIDPASAEITVANSFEVLTGGFTDNSRLAVASLRPVVIPDEDKDGVVNVCDGCQDDPAKSTPGVCGCGVADLDANSNGIIDCVEEVVKNLASIPLAKATLTINKRKVNIALTEISGATSYSCQVSNVFKNRKGKKKKIRKDVESESTDLSFVARKRPSRVTVKCVAKNEISQTEESPIAKAKLKKGKKTKK